MELEPNQKLEFLKKKKKKTHAPNAIGKKWKCFPSSECAIMLHTFQFTLPFHCTKDECWQLSFNQFCKSYINPYHYHGMDDVFGNQLVEPLSNLTLFLKRTIYLLHLSAEKLKSSSRPMCHWPKYVKDDNMRGQRGWQMGNSPLHFLMWYEKWWCERDCNRRLMGNSLCIFHVKWKGDVKGQT